MNGQVVCLVCWKYTSRILFGKARRYLINLKFHGEGQSMRAYIEQVFEAADFLKYEASEKQLFETVVMNFHPDILAKAAFLDRPRSVKDLFRVVSLIEEKVSIANERHRLEQKILGERSGGMESRDGTRAPGRDSRGQGQVLRGAGNMDKQGITRRGVRREPRGRETGNGQEAGRPPGKYLKWSSERPPWMMASMKVGDVAASVNTGAQFSCVCSDVAEFLRLTGEPCEIVMFCFVPWLMGDGAR